jgi:fumarate reductase flavoprotein subunit
MLFCPKANAHRVKRDADGVVRTVTADIDGAPATLNARRGIVIATGGFARGDALITRFAPELERAKRLGGAGVTGDGIRMGWALGGDFVDAGWLGGTFGAVLPHYPSPDSWTDSDTILLHAEYSGAIIINKEGRRFADESLTYRKLGLACLQQTDAIAFQIFDESIMEQSRAVPGTRNFKAAFERGGLIRQADSAAAAALKMGLPADVEETVVGYNVGVDSGVDVDFGRDSPRRQGSRVRIERAPFYIYAYHSHCVDVCRIWHHRMELMDVFGEPVPGFYRWRGGGGAWTVPMAALALGKAAIFDVPPDRMLQRGT